MPYTQSGNQSCFQCESRRLSQIRYSATLLTLNYGFDFIAQHEAFPLKLTLMLSDEINTTITTTINANQLLCFISNEHKIKVDPFHFHNTHSLCFCSWFICGNYGKKKVWVLVLLLKRLLFSWHTKKKKKKKYNPYPTTTWLFYVTLFTIQSIHPPTPEKKNIAVLISCFTHKIFGWLFFFFKWLNCNNTKSQCEI